MLRACLLTISIATGLQASVAFSTELPPIPKQAQMSVAAQSMAVAQACEYRYNRSGMVRNAKAMFFKFASSRFDDPQTETDKAFSQVQRTVTPAYAQSAKQITPELCRRMERVFKRELAK